MASNPFTTGLVLQLDARTITPVADATNVTTWADQTANGNNASVKGAGTAPKYYNNVIGSNPIVQFPAVTNNLGGALSGWSGTAGATIVALIANQLAPTNTFGRFVSLYKSGNANDSDNTAAMIWVTNGVNTTYIDSSGYSNAALWQPGGELPGIKSPNVCGLGVSTTAYRTWINGLPNSAGSKTMAMSPDNYLLGNAWFGSAVLTTSGAKFDLAMIVIYRTLLSDANVLAVSNWMLTEYGIITPSGGGNVSYIGGIQM